jgi:hypothetical protein
VIIADTGLWLALANRSDQHHDRAIRALDGLDEPLITTWPVMTETCHLLVRKLGPPARLLFMGGLSGGAFEVFPLRAEHAPRIVELMRKYRGLPMDLADASLVILAEPLGHGRILSTDRRDFRTYRWKNRKPFENLLEI